MKKLWILILVTLAFVAPLDAQGESSLDRFEDLEERLAALEGAEANNSTSETSSTSGLPEWLERFRISGSANIGYTTAGTDSFHDESSFVVRDARLFIDAMLDQDVLLGETLIVRDIGFTLELNAVRRASFGDRRDGLLGEIYVDFTGVLDSSWLNIQAGRFQLPLGEAYLRYSRGYADRPFVSDSIGGPWYWDEGVRIHGSAPSNSWGYVASISDGENDFNGDANQDPQYTLKLYAAPFDWLHVSATALIAGDTGTTDDDESNSLWLGEMFPTAFGAASSQPNFDGGAAIPDGPNKLDGVEYYAIDVIVHLDRHQQIWLSYGVCEVDSSGSRQYDRRLAAWLAEYVVEGSLFSSRLAPFYAGVRAGGLGTYHDEEGYFIDRRLAGDLGYNLTSATAYSAVVGWHLSDRATLRAEYTVYENNVVSGVTADIRRAANDADYFTLELGIRF